MDFINNINFQSYEILCFTVSVKEDPRTRKCIQTIIILVVLSSSNEQPHNNWRRTGDLTSYNRWPHILEQVISHLRTGVGTSKNM